MLRLTSRIDEVTVYREGARVRRVAVLPAGAERVRLDGLPVTLAAERVRARVANDAGVATGVRVTLEVPAPDPALPPADDAALAAATLAREGAAAEVARIEQARARLALLAVQPRPAPAAGEAPGEIPTAARRALLALRGDEERRLAAALADAQAALAAADRRLTEAREHADAASSARNRRPDQLARSVEVTLAAPAAPGARLEVSYDVPGARWSPAYALAVIGDRDVRLTMRALVAQRTGEDWAAARLVLSTADPQAWQELPELQRLRIGRAQPRPARRGYREPPAGADALYADHDRAFGPPRPAVPLEAPMPPTMPAGMPPGMPPRIRPPMAEAAPEASMMPAPWPAAPLGGAGPRAAAPSLAGLAAMARPQAAGGADGARKRAARDDDEGAAPGGGGAPPQAPPPEDAPPLDLDVEAMAFARLRLRAADDAARGELVPVDRGLAALEALPAVDRAAAAAALRAAALRAAIDAPLPAGHRPAASDDAFDYAYAAELPCDVPGDGAFHAVLVTELAARGGVRLVAVPREAPEVFRSLQVDSPLDAALLPGPVDVLVGEADDRLAFLMTTSLPATPPRGPLRLGLGVEQGVKVARNTSYAERAAGLLGGSLALEHRVEIEVANTLDRPVTVEVRERVPVARADDASVAVELGAVEPPWRRWPGEPPGGPIEGGHAWAVELPPGRARTLRAEYTVKLASRLELVGGNRRES